MRKALRAAKKVHVAIEGDAGSTAVRISKGQALALVPRMAALGLGLRHYSFGNTDHVIIQRASYRA